MWRPAATLATCDKHVYVVNANAAVIVLLNASALMQTLGQMIALLGISFQGNQLNTCKLNIYHFHHHKIQHNFLARKIESITNNWLALEGEDDDSDEESDNDGADMNDMKVEEDDAMESGSTAALMSEEVKEVMT